MDFTPEQLRRIDAAVARAMRLELLVVGYYGTDGESPRQVELREWLDGVGIQSIGEYWIDVGSNWWLESYDWQPTSDYQSWAAVEGFMLETFAPGYDRRKDAYVVAIGQVTGDYATYGTIFHMMTSPLPLRCLAFLRAMGVDVDALLAEGQPAG